MRLVCSLILAVPLVLSTGWTEVRAAFSLDILTNPLRSRMEKCR